MSDKEQPKVTEPKREKAQLIEEWKQISVKKSGQTTLISEYLQVGYNIIRRDIVKKGNDIVAINSVLLHNHLIKEIMHEPTGEKRLMYSRGTI